MILVKYKVFVRCALYIGRIKMAQARCQSGVQAPVVSLSFSMAATLAGRTRNDARATVADVSSTKKEKKSRFSNQKKTFEKKR